MTVLDRILAKTERDPSGCLIFTGCKKDGYGYIWHDGGSAIAHRVVYQMLVGPIPDGWEVDHNCRNRSCVEVKHLEAVTGYENKHRTRGLRYTKTHCPQGHAYNEANTYLSPARDRQCRTCRTDRQRQSRAKEKAA